LAPWYLTITGPEISSGVSSLGIEMPADSSHLRLRSRFKEIDKKPFDVEILFLEDIA